MNRLCSVLVALMALMPGVSPAKDGSIVIGPVHIVSVSTGRVVPGQAVRIRAGRIEQVGPNDALARDAGAIFVDGQNGYLIPGLAEMHAHVPSRDRGDIYVRDVLMMFLANGVTTIRGMLGEPWHLELRRLLETGAWTGPRLITSGPSFNGRTVTSAEQAATRVRQQAAAGYDFLKLHPGLEADEFEALADAAREAGIPFAGHVSIAVGIDAALRRQQASIDHLDGYAQALVPPGAPGHGVPPEWFGINLADDMDSGGAAKLAAATARAGVWNVPTQALLEHTAGDRPLAELLDRPFMRYVSPALKRRWTEQATRIRAQANPSERARFLRVRRQLIRELQNAGAGILLGSDAPQIMNVPGFSVHEELAFLVQAGLTPLEALRSGTMQVGKFFGDSTHGCLEAGCRADGVLLGADPLQDIANTRQILGVMQGGSWYSRADLDKALDDIKERGL
ncbi:MAG: amidohydrolase family protein [Xanthomonadales bacterium]|nr:amidohydrolase family protein [Gammaproteobacteria bacterium]NNK33449.1 amidohydrolase family protein [Xanthomonadales bacterium]NNK38703.1 amidohydrolase family protein [Xanthomonadales bacterium]